LDKNELISEIEFTNLHLELYEKILDFESDQGFKMQRVLDKNLSFDDIIGSKENLLASDKSNFVIRLSR